MKYSRNFLVDFKKALEDTKESPFDGVGICENVKNRVDYNEFLVQNLMFKIFKIWPEYSDYHNYPVTVNGWYCPINLFFNAQSHYRLWDQTTEYGRNRYKLLDFMIETVQDMINFIDETIEENEDDYE